MILASLLSAVKLRKYCRWQVRLMMGDAATLVVTSCNERLHQPDRSSLCMPRKNPSKAALCAPITSRLDSRLHRAHLLSWDLHCVGLVNREMQ